MHDRPTDDAQLHYTDRRHGPRLPARRPTRYGRGPGRPRPCVRRCREKCDRGQVLEVPELDEAGGSCRRDSYRPETMVSVGLPWTINLHPLADLTLNLRINVKETYRITGQNLLAYLPGTS